MFGHGAGWVLECPYPRSYPFKFAGNYSKPESIPKIAGISPPIVDIFLRVSIIFGV